MLSIQDIVKRYESHTALDKVSMEIPDGCIFGLLGPNGAGKTSLIRIINQITAPDSGSITMNGQPLHRTHISRIGYLPEERGLYKKMEVGEQVIYLARLKGLSRSDATARARSWFLKFDLYNWWNKKVEDLSKGMQQKVQFISTVIHEPDLLILDEPFSGFDPINAELVKDEIINFYKQGKSVIFSTHRLERIEEFVTHIALLNNAHKILDGTTRELINQHRSNTYQVDYKTPGLATPKDSADDKNAVGRVDFNAIAATGAVEFVSQFSTEDGQAAIFRIPSGNVNILLSALIPHMQIQGIRELVPTISDIFIRQVKQAETEPTTIQV